MFYSKFYPSSRGIDNGLHHVGHIFKSQSFCSFLIIIVPKIVVKLGTTIATFDMMFSDQTGLSLEPNVNPELEMFDNLLVTIILNIIKLLYNSVVYSILLLKQLV